MSRWYPPHAKPRKKGSYLCRPRGQSTRITAVANAEWNRLAKLPGNAGKTPTQIALETVKR
jgi:hypothetical protein